jgi:glycosyltransferase involved in cell wall biosynthesis
VVFFAPNDPEHGAPHAVMAALWLTRAGFPLSCICFGPAGRTEVATPIATLRTRSVPQGRGRVGRLWAQVKLAAALVKQRFVGPPKLFFVYSPAAAPAAWLGLLGVSRDRVLYQTQDFLEPRRHPWRAFFERRLARRAGCVISNEPNRARFLASNYALRDAPVVVRTALPADWPVPERDPELRRRLLAKVGFRDEGAARIIMAGGGYSNVRCTEELIRAVGLLDERYVLVFTGMQEGGPAYHATLEACRRAGIERRVVVLPQLAYADLLRHMAACDVGILLYPDDGIGNFYQAPGRLTEYLNCGLPVVASNFPGLELLVLKHRLGEVCDPTSPDEIAAALRRLGSRSAEELGRDRARLRQLARAELAYEAQAWRITEQVARRAGVRG